MTKTKLTETLNTRIATDHVNEMHYIVFVKIVVTLTILIIIYEMYREVYFKMTGVAQLSRFYKPLPGECCIQTAIRTERRVMLKC